MCIIIYYKNCLPRYVYENITFLGIIIFIAILSFSKQRSRFDSVLSLEYRGWDSVVERSTMPVLSVAVASRNPRGSHNLYRRSYLLYRLQTWTDCRICAALAVVLTAVDILCAEWQLLQYMCFSVWLCCVGRFCASVCNGTVFFSVCSSMWLYCVGSFVLQHVTYCVGRLVLQYVIVLCW